MEIQDEFFDEASIDEPEKWKKVALNYSNTCAWIMYKQTAFSYTAYISGFYDYKAYDIARTYLISLREVNRLRHRLGKPFLHFIELINERKKYDDSLGISIVII